jgi:hypothetical protein
MTSLDATYPSRRCIVRNDGAVALDLFSSFPVSFLVPFVAVLVVVVIGLLYKVSRRSRTGHASTK